MYDKENKALFVCSATIEITTHCFIKQKYDFIEGGTQLFKNQAAHELLRP